jgi:uncharacterized protein YbjT (DUF2867 family)
MGKALHAALVQANPARVVYLSTIGAQANQSNLLTQHTIIEKAIGGLPNPVTFLRPAWFMENSSWDLAPAREQGVIPGFLQPLDKPVPMVGTADIGKVAAELLQGNWKGHRVVELEGPERVPNKIAATAGLPVPCGWKPGRVGHGRHFQVLGMKIQFCALYAGWFQ